MTGAGDGSIALDRYRDVTWQAKRWAWTDPEKEVNANILAINNRLKSRTRVIAEQGEDIEDVWNELEEEEELAEEKNITLPQPPPQYGSNGAPLSAGAAPAKTDNEGTETPTDANDNENETADGN